MYLAFRSEPEAGKIPSHIKAYWQSPSFSVLRTKITVLRETTEKIIVQ